MKNNKYYIAYSLDEVHPLDRVICEIQLENPVHTYQGNKRINRESYPALLVEKHKAPSRFSFYRKNK